MLVVALFLVGIVCGVFLGARLKAPQIWGAGFVVGGIAGLAVGVEIIIGGVYGRKGGKGESARGDKVSPGMRGNVGRLYRSEWEALFPVLQVRGTNVRSGRERDGVGKGGFWGGAGKGGF